jgi:rhomboid protease GluP
VLGNLISGSIFGAAVSRRIGPGGALMAILGSGVVGNAANALYHRSSGHLSIGASTAVFGAVGLLGALQIWANRNRPQPPRTGMLRVVELGAPIVGGLALLGALGAAPQSDMWAHLFGFLAGAAIGGVLGAAERKRAARPASRWGQLVLGTGALLLVVGCWKLAMMR